MPLGVGLGDVVEIGNGRVDVVGGIEVVPIFKRISQRGSSACGDRIAYDALVYGCNDPISHISRVFGAFLGRESGVITHRPNETAMLICAVVTDEVAKTAPVAVAQDWG